MQHSTFDLQSADGNHFAQMWEPERDARAVVCLAHGFGEHGGRYAHVATRMNEAGYALLTFDLRGHGKSYGQRGHTPSYDHLLNDLALLFDEGARRFPNKPLFIYGQSMGGNLVLNYALRRQPKFAGVLATSPWLRLAYEPPAPLIRLGKAMNRVYPAFTQAANLDLDGLARDPKIVQAYKNDPLVHGKISSRLAISMLESGAWALEHAAEFSLPLLLAHGTADRLTSFGASREFANRVRGDVTFKAWEGLYHETHNEPEKEQVIGFMLSWLDAHAQ